MNISVVVPCYNAAPYIGETLQSVMAQTFTDWECVCVDDGSRDQTAALVSEIAEREPRLRLIRQSNQGVAVARNTGFAAASPESRYFIFLDSDDLWEPELLEVLFRCLESREEFVAAYGLPRFFASGKDVALARESWGEERVTVRRGRAEPLADDEPTTFAEFVCGCWISTPGQVLIRRTAIDAIGLFDVTPEIGTCADWDYWLRLSRVGKIAFVRQTLLQYRQHANNMSSNLQRAARAENVILEKALRCEENSADQRRWAGLGIRWRFARLAKSKMGFAGESLKKGDLKDCLRQSAYAARQWAQYMKTFLP